MADVSRNRLQGTDFAGAQNEATAWFYGCHSLVVGVNTQAPTINAID